MDRLNHIEEIELCKEAQNGSIESKQKMIVHNLGLVYKIANKMYFKNPQYSLDDLSQEGIMGLNRAIEKFDPKEGCRFSTYAYHWIRSFIGRYNDNNRGKIRIPSHMIQKIRNSEDGSVEEGKLKDMIPVVVSLDRTIGEGSSLKDIIADTFDIDKSAEISLFMDQIKNILSDREYKVLCHRYGLDGCYAKSHRECGVLFDLSHAAIYLIEKKAITKLKDYFNAE